MGRRSHDHRAVPLCRRCHEDIEQHRGAFAGMSKEQVAEWLDAKGAELRRRYLALESSDFPR